MILDIDRRLFGWSGAVAVLVLGGLILLPAGLLEGEPASLVSGIADAAPVGFAALLFVGSLAVVSRRLVAAEGLFAAAAGIVLGIVLLLRIRDGLVFAGGAWASALALLAIVALVWRGMALLATVGDRWARLAVPMLFGGLLVYLWEILAVGFRVPPVLLPAPSVVADTFAANLFTLGVDFHQTFIKSVIPGFVIGSGSGFLVAVAIDRSPFLQRGLQPLGNAISAMPIVGIAPIMVMWFGFDWQSKAAVVVVMTFFPMLINTLAGLQVAGAMERDLMRSYAASYPQTLLKLRLPGALPFVFNALKLNSTLALIGAIVAEFFGTPIQGMGFRISTEVARLNVDFVWATIAVAALAGSASYGALALLERTLTFWHPSQRS
ncbi:MAG: ABC transporter permease [Inquilinus sp.]|nr:ABC transporter permease [Inquilinus sp.]